MAAKEISERGLEDKGPPAGPADEVDAAARLAYLDAVLAASPGLVGRLDAEFRMQEVNWVAPGFRRDEILGASFFAFVAPEHEAALREVLDRVRRTGRAESIYTAGAGPHRTEASFELCVVPVDDPRRPGELCFSLLDVTAHLKRRAALDETERRLGLALEASGMGLWSWDLIKNEVYWDDRMKSIMGRGGISGIEQYARECVHPDDRAAVEAAGRRVFATGEWSAAPHRIVRPDGSVRWMIAIGTVIKEDGRIARLIGGNLDVTEQRRAEEQLRHAQRLDAVGALTAGLAHNFNNLLTAIVPALEQLEPHASPEHQALLRDASTAAARAVDLVASLMRLAGRRREATRAPVEIAATVEHALSLCRRTFERHIALEAAIPGDAPSVICEAGALEQVWLNLLLNARDALSGATGRAPRISVEIDRAAAPAGFAFEGGALVRVRVSDNGSGMDAAVRHKAFDPFFTTKGFGEGAGLGLSTSYAIVREHGGTITCDSEPEVGTTFSVYLPTAAVAQPQPRTLSLTPPPRRSVHVLLLDDEEIVRNVVARVLRREGHRVTAVSTQEAAFAALRTDGDIRVMLLDRSIPGGPGERLIPALRTLCPTLRIVLFTGECVDDEAVRLADSHLQKPFRRDELLAALESPAGSFAALR